MFRIFFQEKTRDLYDFLYQNNVEPMLTEKTLKYFEYVWKRTKGSNPQVSNYLLALALTQRMD